MKRVVPYFTIVLAMLFWAASPIMSKIALQSVQPLTLVTLRFLLAVSLMAMVGILSNSLQKINKKDIPLFMLTGFAQPFLYYIFETYGLSLSASPTISEVLLSTSPLLAPVFAFIFVHEKVSWNNIVGILISTAGVVMMLTVGNDSFNIGSAWGVVLLIAAVLTAVIYTTLLKKIPTYYNSLTIVFYVQLVSLLFFIPMWAIMDLPRIDSMQFGWQPLCTIAYLAIFASVLAFIMFCYTVRQIGVTRANAFNNIRPVFTALIMLCCFSEALPLSKWVAMVIVIVGLFICQYQRK